MYRKSCVEYAFPQKGVASTVLKIPEFRKQGNNYENVENWTSE